MTKIVFLPQDYQAPKAASFYMKMQDGENKFRILSQPILGWEDWLDKKPIRFAFDNKPKPIDPKKPVKHFWSMIIWNHIEEEIQILHLTQASIRNSIEALCNDEDWGSPYFYDIKVIKKGEQLETEYTVNPVPHKKLPDHVKDKFNERPINLDALFIGADPFAKDQECYTPGIFSEADVPTTVTFKLSETQIADLANILDECGDAYKELIMKSIKRQFNAASLSEIPLEEFERVRVAAFKQMNNVHAKQLKIDKEQAL
jgi:hypothetical protein